ncbi:MAG: amidoligase [Bacteroidetes bacterium]|jgi:hypothetical protein|nr:amidoligase [Bacteroidota bacterium]
MTTFNRIPKETNQNGAKRKIGFELEFANLNIDHATALIMQLYGGEKEVFNRYFSKVINTELGDFSVKLDANILYEKKYGKAISLLNEISQNHLPDKQWEKGIEELLEKIFSSVVPYEIVAPPVTFDQLDRLEELRKSLYEKEAKGTEQSTFYAFATHINTEVPELNIETIFIYLKAFLLLYPYLLEKHKTNIARKLTPFINPFPKKYVRQILKSDHPPSVIEFIDNYHHYNPTRNRPLDLYPVLAVMDGERIHSFRHIGNVKKRPTFHYRLPNSSIHLSNWSLAREWNSWCLVEILAQEPDIRHEMTHRYLTIMRKNWYNPEHKWKEESEKWIREKLL